MSQRVTIASGPSIVPLLFGIALVLLGIFFLAGIGSPIGGAIVSAAGLLTIGFRTFVRVDTTRNRVTWYGGLFFPMWRRRHWDFEWPIRIEVSFVRLESRGGLLEQELVLEAGNGARSLLTCLTSWGARRATRKLSRGLGLRRRPLKPVIVP